MKTFILTFLISFQSLASCPIDFADTDLCGEIEWLKGPLDGKKSHFQLTFWEDGDKEQTPTSPDYEVRIYAWMIMKNGHNHGGPKMTSKEIEEGVFEVKDAKFFMGSMNGHWEVRADLSREGKVISTGSSKVVFKNESE